MLVDTCRQFGAALPDSASVDETSQLAVSFSNFARSHVVPKIFISYRRDDAAGSAGRLYDRLQQEFGRDNAFIDVDTLQPGDDFIDAIREKLSECDVMLVVIGKRWLTATDEHGARRLDDEGDYLRLELQTALDRRIRVVPVLVDRAPMPRAQELPEPLRRFASRQAVELRDTRWADDVAVLLTTIKRVVAPPSTEGRAVQLLPDVRESRVANGALEPLITADADESVGPHSPAVDAGAVSSRPPAVGMKSPPQSEPSGVAPLPQVPRRLMTTGLIGVGVVVVLFITIVIRYPWRSAPTEGSTAPNQESDTPNRGSARQNNPVTDLQKACDGADGKACTNLGLMYESGTEVQKDNARAVALYQKGCDGGSAGGCSYLGDMYDNGKGVQKDNARAVPLYEKGCDGGSAYGCTNLGRMYENGTGVQKDNARAVALYQKGCDGGSAYGCGNLKRLKRL